MENYSCSLASELRQMSPTESPLPVPQQRDKQSSQLFSRLGLQRQGQAVRNYLDYTLLACSSTKKTLEENSDGSACDHTAWVCVRWQPVACVSAEPLREDVVMRQNRLNKA